MAGDVLFLLAPSALSSSGCGFSFPEQKKDAKPTKRQSLNILTRAPSGTKMAIHIFEAFQSAVAIGTALGCTLQVCNEKYSRGMNHGTL